MEPAALPADALFHLATTAEWEAAQREGQVAPPSLATEGFVHCSWGRQVAGTVAKHFPGATDLLALELDPERLDAGVVEEDTSGSGQAFPHVYAPLPAGAVVAVHPLT